MLKHFLMLSALTMVLAGAALAQVPAESPAPSASPEASQEAPKTVVYGEIGISTMYHGFDVGGDFGRQKTYKGWVTIERTLNDRVTAYLNFWGQRAFDGSEGVEEVDTVGGLLIKANSSTTIGFEAANYKVHDLSVHKLGLRVSKDFKVGGQPLTFSNEIIRFSTSQKHLLEGGIVDRMSLSTSFALPNKFTLSGGPGLGIDNGPFGLGGPAAVLFLSARLERPITKHWSAFVSGKHSRPIAGETLRRPIYSADIGVAFRFLR